MTFTLYIVTASICILWVVWLVQLRSGWDEIPTFRSATRFLDTLPLVSIIMVVKNKNENITQTVYHLMEQNYPRMEIIVVNDRSSHYTGMRMDELKKWSARHSGLRIPLRVIHITHLPNGWSGKNYAYFQAAKQARGRYILFIDGEARLKEDTIYSAVDYASKRSVDHLTLLPKIVQRSKQNTRPFVKFRLFWWSILRKPWQGNDELRRNGGTGFSTFNFIRKLAYEDIGTHEAFKRAQNESDELGKLVKEYGYSQSVMFALDHVQIGGESSVRNVPAASIRTGLPEMFQCVVGPLLAFIVQLMLMIFPLIGWIPLLFVSIGPALLLFISSAVIIVSYRTTIRQWEVRWTTVDALMLPINGCMLLAKTAGAAAGAIKQSMYSIAGTFRQMKRWTERKRRVDEEK